MKKIFYFAYGSNMWSTRIEARLNEMWIDHKVKKIGNYVLDNYLLVLDCARRFNMYSFANIIPQPGAKVEGVLYELCHEQMMRLDHYEALYERQYFDLPDGNLAYTYVSKYSRADVKPELYYINILIQGCLENNLVQTYNTLVNYKQANYKLKKGSKHKII